MSSLYLWVGAHLTVLFLFLFLVHYRNIHFGYGMVLDYNKNDGTVWVSSRLLKSPAGYAGVKNQMQAISLNGEDLLFTTEESFKDWRRRTKPKLGELDEWVFSGGFWVVMKPTLITKKIPVYWSPNDDPGKYSYNPDFNSGLEYCTKTGQYVHTRQLTNEAIRSVYF